MATRILITGSSGYLGSKAVDILRARGSYEIFGLDVREPSNPAAYAKFFKVSVTDAHAMQACFEEVLPQIAVHLAFMVNATFDKRLEDEVDLGGARNFLDACAATDVGKVVFLSSVAAYGAHDDNDQPLCETSQLRGTEGYRYSRNKELADRMAQRFLRNHPACQFVILRPCLFVGRETRNNFFDMLEYPVVPLVRDEKGVRDPLFQFLHEDDMAECLVAAIEKPVTGIFNCAAEGTCRLSWLIRRFRKRSLSVPASLLYPLAKLLWRLHLISSEPAQLDFIRYPWIMDVSRMRAELCVPKTTSEEAFEAFLEGRNRA